MAEKRNYSRAAEELHIVQSTLSKQVRDLEEQLALKLFLRTSQSVEITDAGREFVREAREALFHLERGVNLAKSAKDGAQAMLHIGRSPYTDPYLVATLSSVTLPLFPQVHLSLSSLLSAELEERVLSGKLDMAIVTLPSESPKLTRAIAQVPLFVAMTTHDPLARLNAVSIADMDQREWILFERHVHQAAYSYDNMLRPWMTTPPQPEGAVATYT